MNAETKHKPVNYKTISSSENTLAAIYQPIRHELSLVEQEIAGVCAYMRKAGSHPEPLQTGGKRIRPALLLLSSLFGKEPGQDAIRLAAAVEILHLATLVHDDLIDESSNRRGQPTINKQWGNNAAILAGDYLYALLLEYTAGYEKSIIAALATALRNMVQA
jgi:heptaprenyl diphosphate synthase